MDDRLRELGEVPGYEFDVRRGPWQPRPGTGGAEQRGPGWRPSRPPLTPAQADQAPGPGRPGLLARDTLAAMRARNWITSLAAPLVAAIAVGVACVVVLGANNGGGAAAPSALAAGFPPARLAAADFDGGGRPVEVAAIAASAATEVAVGSASRGCALWVSVDGGSSWHRAALPPAAAGQANAGQLAGVARRIEFVARDLAELTQPVVHLSLSVRFAAAGQIANVVGRNLLFTDGTALTRD